MRERISVCLACCSDRLTTGISKTEKKVQTSEMRIACVAPSQNCQQRGEAET